LHDSSIKSYQAINMADIEATIVPKASDEGMSPKSSIDLLLSRQVAAGRTFAVIQSPIGSKLFEGQRKLLFKFRPESRSNYLRETRSTSDDLWEFALISKSK
jgi:hypothetical protein